MLEPLLEGPPRLIRLSVRFGICMIELPSTTHGIPSESTLGTSVTILKLIVCTVLTTSMYSTTASGIMLVSFSTTSQTARVLLC